MLTRCDKLGSGQAANSTSWLLIGKIFSLFFFNLFLAPVVHEFVVSRLDSYKTGLLPGAATYFCLEKCSQWALLSIFPLSEAYQNCCTICPSFLLLLTCKNLNGLGESVLRDELSLPVTYCRNWSHWRCLSFHYERRNAWQDALYLGVGFSNIYSLQTCNSMCSLAIRVRCM